MDEGNILIGHDIEGNACWISNQPQELDLQEPTDQGEINGYLHQEHALPTLSSGEDTSFTLTMEDDLTNFKPGPLGNKFMEISETIQILNGPYVPLDEIPTGRKDGYYFIVDNTNNMERRINGLRSEFWDDCGSWIKGTSPTVTFIYRNETIHTVHKRDGLYCVEKAVNKKKIYEPVEPQPSDSELLIIKRLYNLHSLCETGRKQFRRRCTYVLNAPKALPRLTGKVAIVEYLGVFPGRRPHGTAKAENAQVYIRTKPKVHEKLQMLLKHNSVKTVQQELNTTVADEFSKQRNEKQLRNIKYRQKIKDKSVARIAVRKIAEMVNVSDFVYSVTYRKQHADHPLVTLMTSQMITNIKRFCGTGRTLLQVDKTFDLGDFYVTPTIFKDLSVITRTTGQHPVTLGPTLIHTNPSTLTYRSFFHDIAVNLTDDELDKLVIGTDEELFLKESVLRCFPGASHVICTRHLRQNTANYLADNVGLPTKTRQMFLEAIYGENGLTTAEDVGTFENKLSFIREQIDKNDRDNRLQEYFTERLLPLLKTHVMEPCRRGRIKSGWTNSESASHILKSNSSWKKEDLPEFINMLQELVESEQTERCCAIHGMGNYDLDSRFEHHRIDIDQWTSLTEEEKRKKEKIFTSDKGQENPTQMEVVIDDRGRVVTIIPAGIEPSRSKRKGKESLTQRVPPVKKILLDGKHKLQFC